MRLKRAGETVRLVRLSNRRINIVRFGNNESSDHAKKKQKICKVLEEEGHYFMTEAIFKGGGRADILVLDEFKVIEIVNSETLESIIRKKGLYPSGLKMEVVRV